MNPTGGATAGEGAPMAAELAPLPPGASAPSGAMIRGYTDPASRLSFKATIDKLRLHLYRYILNVRMAILVLAGPGIGVALAVDEEGTVLARGVTGGAGRGLQGGSPLLRGDDLLAECGWTK